MREQSGRASGAASVRLHTRVRYPNQWPPVSPWEDTEMTTWEDVAARIAQLDGVTRTELSIARHEAADSWAEPRETGLLSVSGGGEGRVLVLYSILDDGLVTSCVVENERGDALETRIAGAEPLSLPARCWVAKDLAVTAALTYAEGGGRDPALCWEPYRPPGDA